MFETIKLGIKYTRIAIFDKSAAQCTNYFTIKIYPHLFICQCFSEINFSNFLILKKLSAFL